MDHINKVTVNLKILSWERGRKFSILTGRSVIKGEIKFSKIKETERKGNEIFFLEFCYNVFYSMYAMNSITIGESKNNR